MLYLSSFLFGLVSYHAAVVKDAFLHKASLIQYGVSILHHAYGMDHTLYHSGALIAFIDRITCRIATCYILYEARTLNTVPKMSIWTLLSYVTITYVAYLRNAKKYNKIHYILHASIHALSTTAAHILLLCKNA